MNGTPEILSLAVRAGLVSGNDVASGAAGVIPLSRTNGVHCVQREGRAVAYAKQAGLASRLDGDDVVAAERLALDRLRLLGLTPALVLQGGSALVWTGAAPGHDLTTTTLDEQSAHRLSTALGRALATLHTAPVDADIPAARAPWPLLAEPLPSMTTHPPDRDRDAVLSAWHEPAIRNALRPLAAAWARGTCWTHGDLSASNVIVDTDGHLTFIDLESAGRGDPCWDLVTSEQTLGSLGLATTVFRRAYAAAGGTALPYAPVWRAVRALVTAWQYAATADAQNHPVVGQLLTQARRDALHTTRPMPEGSR